MWHLLYVDMYVDLWSPIWPNLAASGICFTLAVWRTKVHLRLHREALEARHEELKKHMENVLTKATEGGTDDSVPG